MDYLFPFVVEQLTGKGWETAYEDETTLDGAVDRLKELTEEGWVARLTVAPRLGKLPVPTLHQ